MVMAAMVVPAKPAGLRVEWSCRAIRTGKLAEPAPAESPQKPELRTLERKSPESPVPITEKDLHDIVRWGGNCDIKLAIMVKVGGNDAGGAWGDRNVCRWLKRAIAFAGQVSQLIAGRVGGKNILLAVAIKVAGGYEDRTEGGGIGHSSTKA